MPRFSIPVRVIYLDTVEIEAEDEAAARAALNDEDEGYLWNHDTDPTVEIRGPIERDEEFDKEEAARAERDRQRALCRKDRKTLTPEERLEVVRLENLYDPEANPRGVFCVSIVDPTKPYASVPWHGWAVLAEGEGFRAEAAGEKSPILQPTAEAAWAELDQIYWGRSDWPEEEETAA